MNKNLMWIIGGVVGLALIVGLAWAIAGEEPPDETAGFGTPTVTGTNLPAVENPNAGDPAVGMTAPTVVGTDWDGNEVAIEPDGRPKIVVFLAHWCPHCQAEVPVINNWLANGGLPEGVDMYAATIFTNARRPNFPPQTWLQRENWEVPTVMDNAENAIALGFGVMSTPTYIVLDGENKNLGRAAGEIGVGGLNALAAIAASAVEG
ncbi:MAG: redoxin family protein [Acidimicrobiales bacterium]|jgi:cytochrome c biogenesis protein CcmG/thiol:disulfide interchange protein DsbE|nr:redoxin family protein [Acidimicrobiales bacterium]HLV90689.1 redoxin family protein [Acidimicrobiia bacterium]